MSTDDPSAAALQYLEQAMDAANTLIGELIRRIDDSGRSPRLRVVGGGREDENPSGDGPPRLRVL